MIPRAALDLLAAAMSIELEEDGVGEWVVCPHDLNRSVLGVNFIEAQKAFRAYQDGNG